MVDVQDKKKDFSIRRILGVVQDNDVAHCHRDDEQQTEGQQQGEQLDKASFVSPCPLLKSSTSRRKRSDFGPQATQQLKRFFQTNPYPGYQEREMIARTLKLDEGRIQVRFQNRRTRQKRLGSRSKYSGERQIECSPPSSNIQGYQGMMLVSPADKTQNSSTNDRRGDETAAHTTPGNVTAAHIAAGNITAVFSPQVKISVTLVGTNLVASNSEAATVSVGRPVNVVPSAVPSNDDLLLSLQSTPLRPSCLETATVNIHNAVFLSSPSISLFPALLSSPGQGSTFFTSPSTSLSSVAASSQGYMPDFFTSSTGNLSSAQQAGTGCTPVFLVSPPCTNVASAPHSHPPNTSSFGAACVYRLPAARPAPVLPSGCTALP